MRTLFRTLAVVASATLLAGACGGSSRLTNAEYERRVNRIGTELSATLDKTFSSPKLQNPGSLKDAAEVLSAGQRNLQQAADRLAAINPPERIQSIHDRLVKGFRDFAASFGTFAQATQKGDLAAIQRFSQQVSDQTLPAMIEIQKAIDQLKAKGFDVSRG